MASVSHILAPILPSATPPPSPARPAPIQQEAFPSNASLSAAAAAAAIILGSSAGATVVDALSSDDESSSTSESEIEAPALQFDVGAVCIPHPEKYFKGGEDAFFVNNRKQIWLTSDEKRDHPEADVFAFGIADGVGGWASSGVDPAIFAKMLMSKASEYFVQEDNLVVNRSTPIKALRYAMDIVFDNLIRGSSTALVGVIDAKNELHIANVGDSGLYVFRNGSILYRSEDQLHGFNFPFQLGMASSDTPENALCATIAPKDSDIIVVATDGLFDNLFDEEVQEYVRANGHKQAQQIAQGLTNWAYHRSISTSAQSPFSAKAAEIGSYFAGGKSDDITVLVFKVNSIQSSAKL